MENLHATSVSHFGTRSERSDREQTEQVEKQTENQPLGFICAKSGAKNMCTRSDGREEGGRGAAAAEAEDSGKKQRATGNRERKQ